MKLALATFTSKQASGVGYDRAASPSYDGRDRPAIVLNGGITVATHDYDGITQYATVSVCRNLMTYVYLAAAESAGEMTIPFADNPINRVDSTGRAVVVIAFGGLGDDSGVVNVWQKTASDEAKKQGSPISFEERRSL